MALGFIGKTIVKANSLRYKGYDDTGYLLLTFNDGSRALIISSFGEWSTNSEGEYPTMLQIMEDEKYLELFLNNSEILDYNE